jgi:hypothetical protein
VVQHLFRAVLVQKSGQKYQKDSPDFILIEMLDGQQIVAVVQLKCRSKTKTHDAECHQAGYKKSLHQSHVSQLSIVVTC